MNKYWQLPQDLLLGTATASLQIEGGDRNNNWYRFCEEGRIKDGTHCIIAADHWNRVEEDIALMKEMHQDTYRMSLEWSRIEQEAGVFNEEALEHYHDELSKLVAAGIRPCVTLHHFSHPLWLENAGGWIDQRVVASFVRYTAKVIQVFGGLVSDWVTINEPSVYLYEGYIEVNAPPAKSNIVSYMKGARNMIAAHIEAYKTIHQIRQSMGYTDTRVGVANHIRVFDPISTDIRDRMASGILDHVFHRIFLEGMIKGNFLFPIGLGGYPYGQGTFCDFLGINYYSRDRVAFTWNPANAFGKLTVEQGAPTSEMGWEIYPEGLYLVCARLYAKYPMPIFITENGICDATDEKRSQFLIDHLKQVIRLREEGISVERYYHWSLIDNFEWAEGLSRRFGLIHVDYETLQRTIRPSGRLYAQICKDRLVPGEAEFVSK
ncbi:glycoside hydrolase family 1 protein [Paenibacillus sp. N1-5-1-14]|uniref:glycoside hydrolase family 1 protein n=1 Tax=Paenibacillus radicibacter TaxID=2972488 RepID=UPI002159B238|nr:glycoside hydrolase family 1 protein [Paenibacillus radicibacter]MCR8643089.1 glycoside hydrolase family 1 protein [Paenibacillus radicibacter]